MSSIKPEIIHLGDSGRGSYYKVGRYIIKAYISDKTMVGVEILSKDYDWKLLFKESHVLIKKESMPSGPEIAEFVFKMLTED